MEYDYKMTIKNTKKYFTAGVTILTAGISWLYYEISRTRYILIHTFDTNLLSAIDLDPVKVPNRYIYFDQKSYNPFSKIISLWNYLKFEYSLRLIEVAKCDNREHRIRATKALASLKFLDNSDYQYLAQKLDSQTAVGLARIKNIDKRFFLNPPYRTISNNYASIMKLVKDLILQLNEISKHPCLTHCIESVYQDDIVMIEDEHVTHELYKGMHTDSALLVCLKAISHHSDVKDNAKDIVKLQGLPLLMEIYQRYANNQIICMVLSNIICNVCMYPEFREEIFRTGWLSILASWINHPKLIISATASKALANLDSDYKNEYESLPRKLYVLHPSFRHEVQHPKIDVIIVHGLLGGVFFSWRQRDKMPQPVGLFGTRGPPSSKNDAIEDNMKKSELIDYETYLQGERNKEFDLLDSDFEIVVHDCPEESIRGTDDSLTLSETNEVYENEIQEQFYSTDCWPKDWLTKDYKDIRLIGLNYETNISMWSSACPNQKTMTTIADRSVAFRDNLLQMRVGDKPIVWICHSMGGLVVKKILVNAINSDNPFERKLASNTRGIIFCSTPHKGSQMAVLKAFTSLLIWPTTEVQELKENSPDLLELHEKFRKFLIDSSVKVISFVESQPTFVSALKLSFKMVTKESADPGVGELYVVPLSHLNVCKPKNKSAAIKINSVHSEHTISVRTVQKWFKSNISDEPRSGRPVNFDDGILRNLVESKPQLTVDQIAERMNCV